MASGAARSYSDYRQLSTTNTALRAIRNTCRCDRLDAGVVVSWSAVGIHERLELNAQGCREFADRRRVGVLRASLKPREGCAGDTRLFRQLLLGCVTQALARAVASGEPRIVRSGDEAVIIDPRATLPVVVGASAPSAKRVQCRQRPHHKALGVGSQPTRAMRHDRLIGSTL